MTDLRLVCCFSCDGEGRITHREPGYRIRPWGPEPFEYEEPCDDCDGTGGMLIEVEPIELEDLDTE